MNNDDKKTFSFLNGFGEDALRKNSNYWNFRAKYICPLCNFIFACMPVGFLHFSDNILQFMFINENYDFNVLTKLNSDENSENGKNRLYITLYNILKNFDKNISEIEMIIKKQAVITRRTLLQKNITKDK